MVYSTRRFVVFPCVILFLCFAVLLVLRLPRLWKRELILVLFVRLFGLCLFRFVGFPFLLGSEKGCGLWLWHSLDFSLTFFRRSLPVCLLMTVREWLLCCSSLSACRLSCSLISYTFSSSGKLLLRCCGISLVNLFIKVFFDSSHSLFNNIGINTENEVASLVRCYYWNITKRHKKNKKRKNA